MERGKALANPEAAMVPPISIYLLNLEDNESDYLVTFMLNLLETVSENQLVPQLIGRIILNSLNQ
jgi:hypothetical protein